MASMFGVDLSDHGIARGKADLPRAGVTERREYSQPNCEILRVYVWNEVRLFLVLSLILRRGSYVD